MSVLLLIQCSQVFAKLSDYAKYIASRRAIGSSACSTPDGRKIHWSEDVVGFSSDQVYPKSSSCASSAQGVTSSSMTHLDTSPGPVAVKSDPTWKLRQSGIPKYRRSASYRNSRLLMRVGSSTRFRTRISRSDGNTTSESSVEDPLPSTTPSSPLRDLLPSLYAWQNDSSPPVYLLSAEGESSSRPSPTVRTKRGDALRSVNNNMGVQPLAAVFTRENNL